jgi:hypothetical protein
VEQERAAIAVEGESEVREYAELRDQLRRLHRDRRKIVTGPKHVLPFLQPGRLIRVLCPPAEEDKVRSQSSLPGAFLCNRVSQLDCASDPRYRAGLLLAPWTGEACLMSFTERNLAVSTPCPSYRSLSTLSPPSTRSHEGELLRLSAAWSSSPFDWSP